MKPLSSKPPEHENPALQQKTQETQAKPSFIQSITMGLGASIVRMYSSAPQISTFEQCMNKTGGNYEDCGHLQ